MTLDEIASTAETALRPALQGVGLERVIVEEGYDHDDEPSLFFTAIYRPGSRKPTGQMLVAALGKLRRALQSLNENRFPYLAHRFGEDDRYEDDDEYGAA